MTTDMIRAYARSDGTPSLFLFVENKDEIYIVVDHDYTHRNRK